ncbi:MAG: hypothetical protein U5R31_06820 [Acidimicrobiia bacterium]|nr:hypothetical protein [Acidimicrobiia bacterium]
MIPGAITEESVAHRDEINRVAAVGTIRAIRGFSVDLRRHDGSYWRYLLGPGPGVLDAMEAERVAGRSPRDLAGGRDVPSCQAGRLTARGIQPAWNTTRRERPRPREPLTW